MYGKHIISILYNETHRVRRRKVLLFYSISVSFSVELDANKIQIYNPPSSELKSGIWACRWTCKGSTSLLTAHCIFIVLSFIAFYGLHIAKLILHPGLFKIFTAELTIQTCHLYLLGSKNFKFSWLILPFLFSASHLL